MRPEHFIKDFILARRHGITIDFTIPEEPTYLQPTEPERYAPLKPSEGNRKPSVKSPFNSRGTLPDLPGNRVMYYESGLELRSLNQVKCHPDVIEVREQFPTSEYVDDDGFMRKHTFDIWTRQRDETTKVYAVKPLERVSTKAFLRQLLLIYDQAVGRDFDDMGLITDFTADHSSDANYRNVLRSRRMRNEADYRQALNLIVGIKGTVTFAELLKGTEAEAARRNALWCLIDDGFLIPQTAGSVRDFTPFHVAF